MTERTNKKKILIAIHGLAHAGAERVAAAWANYLAGQGHAVAVLVYACGEDTYELDKRVRIVPIANTLEEYVKTPKPKQLLRIRKLIRQEKPQVMISFLPKMQITMMLATWGLRIKRVETVRNNPWTDTDIAGKRPLWDMCFRRSDAIIVQTKEQAQYFSQSLQKKITVISNPISDNFIDRQKLYQSEGIHKFVSVARLSAQKNYPMMIRAFTKATRKDPSYKLDIYGAGTPETVKELQSLISQLGMEQSITLCGWKKNISEMLPSYDAFLMSSNYEGMPNALAEAMTTGLVCLSTDCKTGPKDMIDHGVNGYLAMTGSVDSFAEQIQRIVQMDREQCVAMGAAAKNNILNMCSRENTLERLKKLIEEDM